MLGEIAPDMTVTPYCIRADCHATPPAIMHRLQQAPDGVLWFTELNRDTIGKIVVGEK